MGMLSKAKQAAAAAAAAANASVSSSPSRSRVFWPSASARSYAALIVPAAAWQRRIIRDDAIAGGVAVAVEDEHPELAVHCGLV